ncbi:MAG: hypothetical protein M3Q97_08415, partial [Bacteroidota bacterium]|nr:hypothetical protein [Bacteroidota bacterium]
MKKLLFPGWVLVQLFLAVNSTAQTKYWVFFTDKDGVSFDPYSYFDEKAIERREKNGVQVSDFSDMPVNDMYVTGIAAIADSMGCESRWFNACGAWLTDAQVKIVRT